MDKYVKYNALTNRFKKKINNNILKRCSRISLKLINLLNIGMMLQAMIYGTDKDNPNAITIGSERSININFKLMFLIPPKYTYMNKMQVNNNFISSQD